MVKAFVEGLLEHLVTQPNGEELIERLDSYFQDIPGWQEIMVCKIFLKNERKKRQANQANL